MTKKELINSSSAGYTNIPNEIYMLDLKIDEKMLLFVVVKWDNSPNHPLSLTFLANACGISRSRLARVKQSLLDMKLIIEGSLGKGKPNTYRVNWKQVQELT